MQLPRTLDVPPWQLCCTQPENPRWQGAGHLNSSEGEVTRLEESISMAGLRSDTRKVAVAKRKPGQESSKGSKRKAQE